MTNNEHNNSSCHAQFISNNGPDMTDNILPKSSAIDRQAKRITSRLGYCWLIYTIFVTSIILFAPNGWIEMPTPKAIFGVISSLMPHIVYISSSSSEPQVVQFAYGIALLAAPGHAAFAIAAVIIRYVNGYTHHEKLKKVWKVAWLFPLTAWAFYFTCLGCNLPPSKHDLLAISSRIAMAFLGQIITVLASTSLGVYAIALLAKLQCIKTNHSHWESNNGSTK